MSGHRHAHDDHGHAPTDHGHEHHDHDHAHDHDHDHEHEHGQHHDHAGRPAPSAPGVATPHHAHAGHKHDHAHGHSHAKGQNATRLTAALAITAGFMLVELIGGWWAHSLALIADAGHMLTDAASLGLALFALRVARRPADAVYSYGHHRFEVLAAFVNGLALLLISIWILIESASRLLSPQPVLGKTMLVVATLGFCANLASFLVLRDGHDNINLRGAVLHVLSDLMGSAAAMIAAVIILLSGWVPIDPLLSGLVSLMILRGGWRITRQSARILLEGAPTGLDAGEITSDLLSQIPGLSGIHHVHAWSLTDERPMLTLHAVLDPTASRDATLAAMQSRLKARFGVDHATVQLETDPCGHAGERPCTDAEAHPAH